MGYLSTDDIAADEAEAEALLAGAEVAEPVEPAVQPTPDPAATPATPAEQPKADPKLEALMERESRVVEREQVWKEKEGFLNDLEKRVVAVEKAKQDFISNPVAYLRALHPELDFDSLARTLWYEKLGDAAPIEHRLTQQVRAGLQEVHKTRAELEVERQRIAEENARKEADAAEARRVEELRGYVTSVPSTYASVQHLAKQKPDVAVRMMHDAARMIAPGLGRTPTAEETAKAVQQYLDEIGYVVPTPAPVPATPVQTQASAQPASLPTTIKNAHSAVQAGRVPPDENDPRVKRRAAFQAMAEALGNPTLANLPVDW